MANDYKEVTYGFGVTVELPITSYLDDELDKLDSYASMLEQEVETLRKMIDNEMKRRGL
jgi:hypothetical protein